MAVGFCNGPQPHVGVRRRISSRPIAASPRLEGCGKAGTKTGHELIDGLKYRKMKPEPPIVMDPANEWDRMFGHLYLNGYLPKGAYLAGREFAERYPERLVSLRQQNAPCQTQSSLGLAPLISMLNKWIREYLYFGAIKH